MLKEKDAAIRRAMIVLDGAVIAAAFFLAYHIRANFHSIYRFNIFSRMDIVGDGGIYFSEYLLVLIVAVPVWCCSLYRNGMYRSWRILTSRHVLWIVFKASLMGFLIIGALFFLLKIWFVSRLFLLTFACLGLAFLWAEKIFIYSVMHAVRKRGYNYRLILIVGTGRRAAEFIRRIKGHPEWGLKILGAVDDEPGRGVEGVDGVEILGSLEDIPGILHDHGVDEVVFIVPRLRLNHLQKSIQDCETEGIKVSIAVDLFDLKIAKSYQSEIDGFPLLTFKTTVPSEGDLFIKRAIDMAVSGAFLVLLSPLLLVLSGVIKLTSKGPVFYKQERIGLNGKRFILYKFRTMYVGAQDNLSQVDIFKEIYEPQWRMKKLRFVTPVGRLLRRFSLDEFPQFFNVFLGHMSLVGPRPTLPQEVRQYETWHRRRFSMRPGLTCLWQVNGRREIQFNEWMKMDLEYLDHWSLWLDFKILVKTIPAVLFGGGAY